MPRVQKNPFAPTSALGWTPGNFQSELQDPYLESMSQSARACATCRFLGHGSSFTLCQGGPERNTGRRVLEVLAAVLWTDS
jgi:hypothetical protein